MKPLPRETVRQAPQPPPVPPALLAPMPPVLTIDRAAAAPLHRQIYQGIREAIVERRLRPGQRLPSSRGLARELAVSRMPVLIAFEQLLAEGYFETRVGAGTFVASSLPGESLAAGAPGTAAGRALAGHAAAGRPAGGRGAGAGEPPPHSAPRRLARVPEAQAAPRFEPWHYGWGAFRVTQPAIDHFPFEAWSRLVARHGRDRGVRRLAYGGALGEPGFRAAVAAYLRTSRAVRCEAEQVLVVSGSQQALALASRVLLDPGSRVWIEEPGYLGARDALAMAGARLVPVPVDAEGLDVAAGIRRSPRARAVYVTPSHQYPLGMTMSASRRLQLLDWARDSGAWVLEDDYDSEYRYQGLPIAALQGLDRDGRVIYIGTFSKVLFPALRLGYMVLPPDLVPRFAAVREALDIFPSTLAQSVLEDFINEGHFARHLRRMRQLYHQRRDALVAALAALPPLAGSGEEPRGALQIRQEPAGMHLVAILPPGMNDFQVAHLAAERGLFAMPLSLTYLAPAPPLSGLVLGYACTGPAEIESGVEKLSDVLRSCSAARAGNRSGSTAARA